MSTVTGIENVVFEELDEAIAPPCDYHGEKVCNDDPARWILFVHCPHCHARLHRFACNNCKDYRMSAETTVYCVKCSEPISPASTAYTRIEAL